MLNKIALVVISFLVGMFHPDFHFKIDWGKGGKADIHLPIFVTTMITALFGGEVGLAFLAELAGRIVTGFLANRKKISQ